MKKWERIKELEEQVALWESRAKLLTESRATETKLRAEITRLLQDVVRAQAREQESLQDLRTIRAEREKEADYNDALQKALQRMESDLGKVRNHLGKERWEAIIPPEAPPPARRQEPPPDGQLVHRDPAQGLRRLRPGRALLTTWGEKS